MALEIIKRPRRLRVSAAMRAMVEETQVQVSDLIFPMFMLEGSGQTRPIHSMPGIYKYSLDMLTAEVGRCIDLGIHNFCLFPNLADSKKDTTGSYGLEPNNIYAEALHTLKTKYPEISLMTDVALDPYSSDGHDGVVQNGQILNDETVEILMQMAVVQAQAGADIIGPSDMMDGRVGYIRKALDAANFSNVAIMSYTAKYASAFYGPFRDALDSAPKFGDKKTYQMNPANIKEAFLEAELDTQEGADILMVKPALAYLDIIKTLNQASHLPISAYNVSGEYAMIKAAAQNGWIDGPKAMHECLLSIKRAGAKIIFTYFAKEYAHLLAQTNK
jgi:porphobilinogen synthase